ncbi:MAG: hypothetical protein J6P44_00670 [Bacteroidales bacterium]|nr:hypothetical protein [Bacteroidales bacterium]
MKNKLGFLLTLMLLWAVSGFSQENCKIWQGYTYGFEDSESGKWDCLTIFQESGSDVHRQALSSTGGGNNTCYDGSYALEFKGGTAVVVFPEFDGSYDGSRFTF